MKQFVELPSVVAIKVIVLQNTIQHTTLSAVTHCLHVWSAAAIDCFYRVGPRNFPVSRGKPEPFKPCSAASPPVSPGQVWARARPRVYAGKISAPKSKNI